MNDPSSANAEKWLPVVGYEGCYEVSDWGRVRSLPRRTAKGWVGGRVLKCGLTDKGYVVAILSKDGYSKRRMVHHLVAAAFIGPWPEGAQLVRHLNDISTENYPANLAYGTYKENHADMLRNGHNYFANRTECPQGHPYDEKNTYWAPRGGRGCRACFNEKSKRRNERQMRGEGEPCTTPGCTRGQIARGLCATCYARKRKADMRGAEWYQRICPHCGTAFEVGIADAQRQYCSPQCLTEKRRITAQAAYQERKARTAA